MPGAARSSASQSKNARAPARMSEWVPLVRQIDCVRREIAHLDRVYDRLLIANAMQAAGDVIRDRVEMSAILRTLQQLQSQEHPEIGFEHE